MSKEELIKILSERLPEDADITYASVTWWDDIGCHNWSTDIEDSD